MKKTFPTSFQLKMLSKKLMRVSMLSWIKITLLLVVLQVGLHLLGSMLGGTLGYYMLSLSDYPKSVTGIFPSAEGFSLIFRMEMLGIILAFPFSYHNIVNFLLINFVIFLFLTPIKYAVLEQYWLLQLGKRAPFARLLHWYQDLRLVGKTLLVEAFVSLGYRIVGIGLLLPGFGLYYLLYSGKFAHTSIAVSLLAFLAMTVLLLGALFTFYVYSMLIPIRYCMASHTEFSVGQVIKKGIRCLRGYRMQFFKFRLSFLPWYVLSQITYGASELYVFPYTSMGSMLFLHEMARCKQMEQ